MLFAEGKPAIMAGNSLVLADIHIGIEHELFEKGIRAKSPNSGMLSDIMDMVKEHSPSEIILLGDVKHSFTDASPDELRDLREFLRAVSKKVPVVIVPGNHDGGIGRAVGSGEVKVSHASGLAREGFGFFHGHSWPSAEVMAQETVIMAHQHPLIELVDRVGGRHSMRAWCVGELTKHERFLEMKARRAIIVPAFNPLAGGAVLNRMPVEGTHGPVMKNMFKLAKSEIYLLDGTPLGRVEDLASRKA